MEVLKILTKMKTMKNSNIFWVAGILVLCLLPLALYAQSYNTWQSTSTLPLSGSSYSSQITEVGAKDTYDMTSTGDNTSYAGPRRSKENPGEIGETGDESSPVGDAALPLLLFAAAAAATVAIRNRRRQVAE